MKDRTANNTSGVNVGSGKFSVCRALEERYQIRSRPGQKIKCPFCDHTTFQVHRSDAYGFCFHPRCYSYLNRISSGKSPADELGKLLGIILKRCRLELRRETSVREQNGYTYLTGNRFIHPDVLALSPVGIIPEMNELRPHFVAALNVVKAAIEEINSKLESGEPVSEDEERFLSKLIDQHAKLVELEELLEALTGWIVFFYTDAKLNISFMRFRKPFSKDIRSFAVYAKRRGVFQPMIPPESSAGLLPEGQLLVVEGELNGLQLLSCQRRLAEKRSANLRHYPVIAVGSVHGADYGTIKRLSRLPVFCYDNDCSYAGFQLVERARQHLHLEAFTTPLPDSDLDEFLLSYGTRDDQAMAAFEQLLERRVFLERHAQSVGDEIFAIRCSSAKDVALKKNVLDLLFEDLLQRCNLYTDGRECYLFLRAQKRMIQVDPDDIGYVQLMAEFGIYKGDGYFTYLTHAIYSYILKHGVKTAVHNFAHYDSDRNILYIGNNDNAMYRVTTEGVSIHNNGYEDMLFRQRADCDLIEPELDAHVNDSLMEEILFEGLQFREMILTANQQAVLILIWFYGLFFSSIMPTRAILTMIADGGSGKTTLLRIIGRILFGHRFEVTALTDRADDFHAALTNDYYLILDNVDDPVAWLEDNLARAATGSTIKRRRYYTTNNMVDYVIDCFIGITSRTPRFTRPDVASRLLPIYLQELQVPKSEEELKRAVLDNRNRLWGVILRDLQHILRAIEQCENPHSMGFRMADFSRFAYIVASYLGKTDEMSTIFTRLKDVQVSFSVGGADVYELIGNWAYNNDQRWISSSELAEELNRMAKEAEIANFTKLNAHVLGQVLTKAGVDLRQLVHVERRTLRGNRKEYRISPVSYFDAKADEGEEV